MPLRDDRLGSRFDRRRENEARYKAGLPGEDEAPLPKPVEPIKVDGRDVGRNDPCPCGSGRKYKKCCGK